MAKIKLSFPIEEAHGYLAKSQDTGFGITCTALGEQVSFYRKSRKRNTKLSPYSQAEVQQHTTFAQNAQAVQARMDSHSSTYVQDVAAWKVAKETNPGLTFRKYLWSVI